MQRMLLHGLFLSVLFIQLSAGAAPKLSTEDYSPDQPFRKNIYKGNQEVNISGTLGYSSFNGVYTEADLSYRYFFADKLSLGPIFGGYWSDTFRAINLGVSGRWYFAEVDNWAFSFTQNITYSGVRSALPVQGIRTAGLINGMSQLSANYFFTPAVYLGISLDYEYNLSESGLGYTPGSDLTSRIGFGVTF